MENCPCLVAGQAGSKPDQHAREACAAMSDMDQKMTQKMLANTAHAPTLARMTQKMQTSPKDHWIPLEHFDITVQLRVCSRQMNMLFAKTALRYTNTPIPVYV